MRRWLVGFLAAVCLGSVVAPAVATADVTESDQAVTIETVVQAPKVQPPQAGPPVAQPTVLLDCTENYNFHWYTGLRWGAWTICVTQYSVPIEQQRVALKCRNDTNSVIYYRYGPWKNVNGQSNKNCDNGYHVALDVWVQFRVTP